MYEKRYKYGSGLAPGKYVTKIVLVGLLNAGSMRGVSIGRCHINVTVLTIEEDGERSTTDTKPVLLSDVRRMFRLNPNIHATCFKYLQDLRNR
jgi:hypothetical protein